MGNDFNSICWLASLAALGLLSAAGCGGGSDVPSASISSSPASNVPSSASSETGDQDPVTLVPTNGDFRSPAQADEELHPEVAIKTNMGTIRVRLNWEKAPRTVANFLYNYVETKFYDQTVFHFVENGYMIAGGGYTVAMEEKSTEPPIPCEADNQLSNKRGTLAMARLPGFAGSATSQFFINLVDNPGLDYKPGDPNGVNGYCVFGDVIDGMDVVERIAQVAVQNKGGDLVKSPVQPVVVETITRVK